MRAGAGGEDRAGTGTLALRERFIPGTAVGASALGVVLGLLSLGSNSVEAYPVPLLGLLSLTLLFLVLHLRSRRGVWPRSVVILLVLALASAVTLWSLPEYLGASDTGGGIHRSLISALLLLSVSIPAACVSLYHFLGATPKGHDASRYPIVVLPVVLALMVYALLSYEIVAKGAPDLDFKDLFFAESSTMREFTLGTLLLIGLTSAISLPVGVGTGLFLNEYGGRLSGVLRFCITAMRAMSVFILGLAAFSFIGYFEGTPLADVFVGYWVASDGGMWAQNGSFITAALFLSILVIPTVARATEEALRSVPVELREGSLALGTSEGRTVSRILLPWSLPNIITGLILGCAEAAGSVAVIMFLISSKIRLDPTGGVTGLAPHIFRSYREGETDFAAALLLVLITVGLTVVALILKQRFARRYRAGMT